jgi:NTE family protein
MDIALALSGGGARGVAHIHVLEAFDDLGIKPAVIAGSSIGAIIGAGYAAGMTGAQLREHSIKTFANRSDVMARLWQLRPKTFTEIFQTAPRLGELDALHVLRSFMPLGIPERFGNLQIPLLLTATDFYGNRTTVISEGELWPAMAASSAIPVIFKPVLIDGRYHVDGGISNPVPFDLVEGDGRAVMAVDVVGLPDGDTTKMPTRIDAAFGASQLMMQALTQFKLKHHRPDALIRPAINAFRVLNFMQTAAILAHTEPTRAETRRELERLLKL